MATEGVMDPVPAPGVISASTLRGLLILGAAVGLGVLADLLLRTAPWGINLPLWVGAVAVACWWCARLGQPASLGARLLLAPAVVFAAAFAWRDSVLLNLMNLGLVLACLGLAPATAVTGRFWHAGVGDYLNAWVHGLARGIAAFALPALVGIRWPEVAQRVTWAWVGPAARGVGLSLPLLLFFGSFLLSADPIFQRAMADLFRLDWWELVGHGMVVAAGFWIAGGLVWHAASPVAMPTAVASGGWRIGAVETAIALNALNLMLLAFIAVQVRYLFGGASVVEASTSLTYAEYARRGFFELVTVGAAALVLLLTAEAATHRTSSRQEWLFRASAGLLVVLVLAVLASAVQRMLIYQQQYGLTELRVYTVAFMAWMAVTFVWFAGTSLAGHGRWFAVGALVAALAIGAALNVWSVDRAIAAANVDRPDFDAAYHGNLSADAVPTLVGALPALPWEQRSRVAACLLAHWDHAASDDWRGWNAARDEAARLVRAQTATLRAWAGGASCYGPSRRIPN